MDLSKFSNCLIRNRAVASQPEEIVRQQILGKMVHELGFPKGLIAVEKQVGTRRFDIVVYTQSMDPLLLVECKAGELTGAQNQAFGYNETIKAPFICLAGSKEIRTMWVVSGRIESVPFLPTYRELCSFQCI